MNICVFGSSSEQIDKIYLESAEHLGKKIAEKGDILISVRAPIGAINIADEKCCIGRGVAAIRPNQEVMSPDFLQHQLFASRNKLEAMGLHNRSYTRFFY